MSYGWRNFLSLSCFILMFAVPLLLWINHPETDLLKPYDNVAVTSPLFFNENIQYKAIPPFAKIRDIGILLETEKKRIGLQVGFLTSAYMKDVLTQWRSVESIMLVDHISLNAEKYNKDESDDSLILILRNIEYQYKGNIKVCRESRGVSCITTVANSSIDFIFIVGRPQYSEMQHDMTLWWTKLSVGGLLCGHSYHSRISQSPEIKSPRQYRDHKDSGGGSSTGGGSRSSDYVTKLVATTDRAVTSFAKRVDRQIQLSYDEADVSWCIRR